MRNQLVKDLEGFNCGVCPHKARLKEKGIKECWEGDGGDCDKYALEWAANRLTDLGYVKVVRCGQCRWLEERVVWQAAGGEASKMYICKSPHSHMKGIARFDGDYYCSEGEAKEGANA